MEKKAIEKQILIAQLVSDSLHRKLTEKEQSILNSWLNKSKENKSLYNELIDKSNIPKYIEEFDIIDQNKAKKNILNRVKNKRVRKLWQRSLKYAAIIVIAIGSYYISNSNENILPSELNIDREIITLELENGDIRQINPDKKSNILNKNGTVVGVQSGFNLVYERNTISDKLVYNTLNVPYGKKFQLELSDGTLVHLNAGSSLKYPVNFLPNKERKVFIRGEGYFEVHEDKTSPFIVNANDINIRVLGTKFNISSYEEDSSINTVLVEGSVSLYREKDIYIENNSTPLLPGYKASWNKTIKEFSLKKVDTRIYTAWTGGKLLFKNIPFKLIRKKLERHYNVTIINNNKTLDEKMYNASFDIETIEQVMKSFNENFSIEFSIIDNKIIIN